MSDVFTLLTNPKIYESIIDNYRLQLEKRDKLQGHEINNVDKPAFANEIAEEIANQQFRFFYPIQKRLQVSHRKKLLYTFNLKDLIVQKALLSIIVEPFLKISSSHLYSYLPGRNYKQPVNQFIDYIKKNTNKKGKIDLWLYRTDIRHYYEDIPVGENALLWTMLDNFFNQLNLKNHPAYIKSLFVDALRPVYQSIDNANAQNIRGIPYGAPISGVISNLYLMELDFKIEKIPNLFYVRYCDDILIAHYEKKVVNDAIDIIYQEMQRLGLIISETKEKRIYFTQSGSPSTDKEFKGVSAFHFLGMIVRGDGNIHASHRRTHKFLMFCKNIILETGLQYHNLSLDHRGKEICEKINNSFVIETKEGQTTNLKEVILRSSCHQFLKQLDYQLALWIAQNLSGIKGVRAFRKISYQKIRDEWGLMSLVMMRNQLSR